MTLGEQVQESLSDWKPVGDGPHTLARPATGDGTWGVTVSAEAVDAVAARLTEVTVARPADGGGDVGTWATHIAEKASGLRERLKVHEVDAGGQRAVLRSDAPTVKGTTAEYYEVQLAGTHEATVKRFQADRAAGTPREQIPYALTHETVGQLIDDVTGG